MTNGESDKILLQLGYYYKTFVTKLMVQFWQSQVLFSVKCFLRIMIQKPRETESMGHTSENRMSMTMHSPPLNPTPLQRNGLGDTIMNTVQQR